MGVRIWASVLLAIGPSPVWAQGSDASFVPRLAWLGLDRGPLSPADAEHLEAALLGALGQQEGATILDARGHPLGRAAETRELAAAELLLRRAIDRLLSGKLDEADQELERVERRLETQLAHTEDRRLHEDTILARAELSFTRGQKEEARAFLAQLAALEPKQPPTTRTHEPALVELYKAAKKGLGKPVILRLSAEPAARELRVDGAAVEDGADRKLAPGRHTLSARWTGVVVSERAELWGKQPLERRLVRGKDPAVEAALEAARARIGADAVSDALRALRRTTEASGYLIGLLRREGPLTLLGLAFHGPDGRLVRATSLAWPQAEGLPADARLALLAAQLTRPGAPRGSALGPTGPATDRLVLADRFYAPGASWLDVDAPPRPVGPADWTETRPPPPEDPTLLERWWFWAAVGAAVAGGVTATLVATRASPTTTRLEIVLPGS